MALKKSDLYRSLWQSCDELRGGMDASQYKDYVLTLLFMKYVSDKYAGKDDALIDVPEGGGFADMVKLKNDKEIGDRINKIIGTLAEANELKGVIDVADFNDEDKLGRGKEMVDRLTKLVGIFESVDFRANRAEGDDLLGDAYEYLMRHFATESGKSKGQFYTPAEVSRIMAKVVGIDPRTRQDQAIYDPTCGSGSLLLKAADESPRGITIYGQENDVATWALAKMNMILHGHPTAELWRGNTLSSPHFKNKDGSLKTFDFAVANPPFSMKAWSTGFDPLHDEFRRFEYGFPPAKNGDYAFLLQFIASLKSTGKGAIILPHGVLFRGNKEADIRKNLVTRGFVKGIIGLPTNLFYGTGIPACIVVIDKEHAQARTGIFMIDASKGFMKDGNKNRLRARDIHRIVDAFNKQTEIVGYSRMVPTSEIALPANDYNLNIPRYIDSSDAEDIHDLDAHLRGGIPDRDIDALQPYWDVFPSLRAELFEPGDRAGYSRARVDTQQVSHAISDHKDFKTFAKRVADVFESWMTAHEALLSSVKEGTLPREVIEVISEDLLHRFELPLLNTYRVYQRLMDYWAETMQDDIYLVAADGWVGAAKPRATVEDKERKIKESPDLTVGKRKYKMDLLPPTLLAARFFAGELRAIEELEVKSEATVRELAEFVEENTSEDGPLEDAKNDKGEVTKGGLKEAITTYKDLPDSDSERNVLDRCSELFESGMSAEKLAKGAKAALDVRALARYDHLTEEEIKTFVVHDKWFASLRAALDEEVDLLSRGLADRFNTLERRYEFTLSELEDRADSARERVATHLKDMGLKLAEMHQLLTGASRLPGFEGAWTHTVLGTLGTFSKGRGISRSEVRAEGLPCIRYGELYTRYRNYTSDLVSRVSPESAAQSQPISKGDLLFAASGETKEDIGTCVAYIGEASAFAGGDIIILKPKSGDSVFLAHLLNHATVSRQKARLGQGDAVVHISARSLAALELRVPSYDEQRAIGRVLFDLDHELAALNQQRQKMHDVKTGMMQNLLTGRVRLPVREVAK